MDIIKCHKKGNPWVLEGSDGRTGFRTDGQDLLPHDRIYYQRPVPRLLISSPIFPIPLEANG